MPTPIATPPTTAILIPFLIRLILEIFENIIQRIKRVKTERAMEIFNAESTGKIM